MQAHPANLNSIWCRTNFYYGPSSLNLKSFSKRSSPPPSDGDYCAGGGPSGSSMYATGSTHPSPALVQDIRLSCRSATEAAAAQSWGTPAHFSSPYSTHSQPISQMAIVLTGDRPSRPAPVSSPTVDDSTSQGQSVSARSSSTDPEPQDVVVPRTREKKHGCWMCHKSFDRPSTLRKHLLVHTGEKAYVCESCGRRFGVASNLNRHAKKCKNRLVQSGNEGSSTDGGDQLQYPDPLPPLSLPSATAGRPSTVTANNRNRRSDKRGRSTSPPLLTFSSLDSTPIYRDRTDSARRKPSNRPTPLTPKRRRRAPSPSHWIPHSLLAYNLTGTEGQKSTPVPLPPVTPIVSVEFFEERDSYDGNVGMAPYANDWSGKLPGPGLGLAMGLVWGNGCDLGRYVTGRLRL